MHCRAKIFVIAASLALAFSLSTAAQIGPNSTVPEGFGVCVHFTDPKPGELKMLADSGARWIRTDFYWDRVERAKGQYDFSEYDRLMAALKPYNIRALLILDYGNKLYDDGLAPHTDAGRQAFAQWAAASVRHFQGQGILWEMWNEPDDGFWKPQANVDDYIKLALAVGQALRTSAPGEAYIGPATSGFPASFLEACFKAGLLNYWSAVSIHPYRVRYVPETVFTDYQSLRSLISKYAPAGKKIPIIASEWGYTTDWAFVGNEENQAALFARALLTNSAAGIPLTFWYQWWGDGFALTKGAYSQGHDPVYEPRPSYLAARTLTSVLSGYRFDRLLPASSSDYILQFANGNKTIVAAWTLGSLHGVTVPVKGRFRVIGTKGEALPAPAAGGQGVYITLTQAPQHLVPQ